MPCEDWSENIVNAEEFSLQNSFNLLSVLLQNISSPHSDDTPCSEVPEEVFATNLSEVFSFQKPFFKRGVLHRGVF